MVYGIVRARYSVCTSELSLRNLGGGEGDGDCCRITAKMNVNRLSTNFSNRPKSRLRQYLRNAEKPTRPPAVV